MPSLQVEDPSSLKAWSSLVSHARDNSSLTLNELFAADSNRFRDLSIEFEGFLLDYSRCLVTPETMSLLNDLANERQLVDQIELLFRGATVNVTEQRSALHTALRGSGPCTVGGEEGDPPVDDEVLAELEHFLAFADTVRMGDWRGFGGQRIERVINIGIGGSDLGPRLISSALRTPDDPVAVHYVAGIDGIELERALTGAQPETTLFIVCSKTFTTLETRLNADAARAWLLQSLPVEAIARHFAAVSVNHAAMDEFGIGKDVRFSIWDWVGGRFSLWSAIGVSSAIAIGSQAFRELLAGAAAMDDHFRSAPVKENIPVVMGLLAVWQQTFLQVASHVVLPYDQRLELLPAYLQQLFMESLGKGVRIDGSNVDYSTGVPVWGAAGSNSQHSFAQLLHQGNASIQVDYIATVNGPDLSVDGGHLQGIANMIAQAESLAVGQSEQEVADSLAKGNALAADLKQLIPHKVHPGNRAALILLMSELNARNLGTLLAMYEHQVFVQAAIWGINPFDQWGVELGKARAGRYAEYLEAKKLEHLPGIGETIGRWRNSS